MFYLLMFVEDIGLHRDKQEQGTCTWNRLSLRYILHEVDMVVCTIHKVSLSKYPCKALTFVVANFLRNFASLVTYITEKFELPLIFINEMK